MDVGYVQATAAGLRFESTNEASVTGLIYFLVHGGGSACQVLLFRELGVVISIIPQIEEGANV